MSLTKSSYLFLIFCGISFTMGNSTQDSVKEDDFQNVIDEGGVRFPLEVSQDVLASFLEMEVHLKNLVNTKRQKRDLYDQGCNHSSSLKFENFTSVIEQTRELLFIPPLSCNNTDKEADICNTAVNFIDCGVVYFRNAYKTTFSYQLSLEVNEKLFHAYELFTDKSKLLLDEITNHSSHGAKCCSIKEGTAKLLEEAMETPLNRTKNDIQSSRVKHCIWEISMGRSKDAADTFERLQLNSTLTTIIQEAYNNHHGGKGHQNYYQILRFIEELSTCSQKEVGYISFFKILMASYDAISFEMLLFSESLKKSNCSGTISLETDVYYLALEMAWAWGADVRAHGRNVSTIYDFSIAHNGAFVLYLDEIIKKAYNRNIRNAKNVLEFIDGLPFKSDDIIAYVVMFYEMKETTGFDGHEIFMAAYGAYKRGKDPGAATYEEVTRALNVRNEVPTGIRNLLFGNVISIQSKAFPNISIGIRDRRSSNPVACPPGKYYDFNSTWVVTALENARYFRFTDERGKSLTVLSSSDEVSVSTGNTHRHHWEVTPVHNGDYFYFKNRATGDIIEADDFGESGVFKDCATLEGVGQNGWHRDKKYWSFSASY